MQNQTRRMPVFVGDSFMDIGPLVSLRWNEISYSDFRSGIRLPFTLHCKLIFYVKLLCRN